MVFDKPVIDEIEELEEIYVQIDGLYIPFPVKELNLISDRSAQLRLEFVSTQDEAFMLVECKTYTAKPYFKEKTEAEIERWNGYNVIDSKYGKIGTIKKIEDYKGNIVLQIIDGDKETLISLFPDLITDVDNDTKTLYISAPEGYFF